MQDEICVSAIDKLRASAPSATKPPSECLIKDTPGGSSGSRNKRKKLDDAALCPYTPATSSNVQTAIMRLAKNKIVDKERKMRIVKGARLVLNQIKKKEEQAATAAPPTAVGAVSGEGEGGGGIIAAVAAPVIEALPSTSSNASGPPVPTPYTSTAPPGQVLSDLTSILGENPLGHTHPPLSPMSPSSSEDEGDPLAPTEQQVQNLAPEVALEEAYGLTPDTGQVRRRDSSNVRSMASYAKRGTGTNTGKYGTFNASLST